MLRGSDTHSRYVSVQGRIVGNHRNEALGGSWEKPLRLVGDFRGSFVEEAASELCPSEMELGLRSKSEEEIKEDCVFDKVPTRRDYRRDDGISLCLYGTLITVLSSAAHRQFLFWFCRSWDQGSCQGLWCAFPVTPSLAPSAYLANFFSFLLNYNGYTTHMRLYFVLGVQLNDSTSIYIKK